MDNKTLFFSGPSQGSRYKKTISRLFVDNFSLNAEFNVQLTLRTSSRDGVLFLITGNSTSSPGNTLQTRDLVFNLSNKISACFTLKSLKLLL